MERRMDGVSPQPLPRIISDTSNGNLLMVKPGPNSNQIPSSPSIKSNASVNRESDEMPEHLERAPGRLNSVPGRITSASRALGATPGHSMFPAWGHTSSMNADLVVYGAREECADKLDKKIERNLGLWGFGALDLIRRKEPQKPSIITCCCGSLALVFVLGVYSLLSWQHFDRQEPTISITTFSNTDAIVAPIPDIGLSLGENFGIEPINLPTLLRHFDISFKLRKYEYKHEFGRVKSEIMLPYKVDEECHPPFMRYQNQMFLCVLRDATPYSAIEQLYPLDVETKQRMGNKDVIERTTIVDNIVVGGHYNDNTFSWVEITLKLNTQNLSLLHQEINHDSQGRKRKLKTNLWARFEREAWSSEQSLEVSEWEWHLYDLLPSYTPGDKMSEYLHWNLDMTVNRANVGPMRAFARNTGKDTKKYWWSFEGVTREQGKGTLGEDWTNGEKLIEFSFRAGSQMRDLTVTYPTFADGILYVGASYSVALGFGTLGVVLLTLCLYLPWAMHAFYECAYSGRIRPKIIGNPAETDERDQVFGRTLSQSSKTGILSG